MTDETYSLVMALSALAAAGALWFRYQRTREDESLAAVTSGAAAGADA
jgi:hypothetical protein